MSKRKAKWWSRDTQERTEDMSKKDKPTGAVAAGPATPVTENLITGGVRQMMDPNLLLGSLPASEPVTAGTPVASIAPAPASPPEEISDPAYVLRLAMLEERMQRLVIESQARANLYDAKITELTQQMQVIPQQLESLKANKKADTDRLSQNRLNTGKEIQEVRELLSKKHQIDLSLYGYNDVAGTLNLLPQSPSQQAGETQSQPVATN